MGRTRRELIIGAIVHTNFTVESSLLPIPYVGRPNIDDSFVKTDDISLASNGSISVSSTGLSLFQSNRHYKPMAQQAHIIGSGCRSAEFCDALWMQNHFSFA